MKLKYWKKDLGNIFMVFGIIPLLLITRFSRVKSIYKEKDFSEEELKRLYKGLPKISFLYISLSILFWQLLVISSDKPTRIIWAVIIIFSLWSTVILLILGFKLLVDFYDDFHAYPTKYKVFHESSRYIEIDQIEFNKIDTFFHAKNQKNYVILKRNNSNFVGKYNEDDDSLEMVDEKTTNNIILLYKTNLSNNSYYRGGLLGHFFFNLLLKLVTIVTLGIAWPFLATAKLKYVTSRTYINGEKQIFDGNPMQLFGKYILWLFLTVITLGVYSFWLKTNVKKWTTKHTHFAASETGESQFIGGAFGYYFLMLGLGILKIMTFGILSSYAHCVSNRYLANNTIIDGVKLRFDGTATQYFGKRILWLFLTIVTLGIYSLWFSLNSKKWIVKHTVFRNEEDKNMIRGLV